MDFSSLSASLELREDRLEVADAIKNKSQAIRKMLEKIHSISKGYDAKWYARGLILSMTETAEHIRGGMRLVKQVFGDLQLPVVPLFENQLALENCKPILHELFKKRSPSRISIKNFMGGDLKSC